MRFYARHFPTAARLFRESKAVEPLYFPHDKRILHRKSSMDSTLNTDQVASDICPRPSKRRKFYRKRGEEDLPIVEDEPKPDADATDNLHALTLDELISHEGSPHGPDAADQRLPLSAAEIISRRKAQRRRLGIEFNNLSSGLTSSAPPESSAVVEHDDTPQMKTINDRFAPQRGQVADVDKHM
jgi:hypothetical protein